MIDTFKGEFLIHPCAVDVSVGGCGYHCLYCFAKKRKGKRPNTVQDDIRMLKCDTKSKSLMMEFLKRGYPICLSNRTDPFSDSMWPSTSAMIDVLCKRKNPILIQTKGGKHAKEGMERLQKAGVPVVLYVTITSNDPEICKKIEVGAPPPKERVELIRWAAKHGIPSMVGFNPMVEQWWPKRSLQTMEKRLLDAGCLGFLEQKLFLKPTALKLMSDATKALFGEDVIEEAARKPNGPWFVEQVKRQMKSGYHVFACSQPWPTEFYEFFKPALQKCMPINQDFVNACAARGEGIATFDQYRDTMFSGHEWMLAHQTREADKYILCRNRGVWKGSRRVQSFTTLLQTVREFWNNKRLASSPQNNLFFQTVVDEYDKPVKDESGNIMLYFDGAVHSARTGSRTRKEKLCVDSCRTVSGSKPTKRKGAASKRCAK